METATFSQNMSDNNHHVLIRAKVSKLKHDEAYILLFYTAELYQGTLLNLPGKIGAVTHGGKWEVTIAVLVVWGTAPKFPPTIWA